MAKISLDLAKFKSAGVYTIELDETAKYVVDTNATRLLVGFSNKGPYNKPVFLRDAEDLAQIFGNIDTKLEHKGSYFHRMATTLLNSTPIVAINLLNVDKSLKGPDQVNYAAFSLDSGAKDPEVTGKGKYDERINKSYIPNVGHAPYAQMFDRSRFWEPSDENLLATVANKTNQVDVTSFEHTNFLNFANVGTEEFSILVFKPETLTGYDITAAEWYGGKKNIPYSFIRPNDYMKDYFLQVVLVKGNWSNTAELSTDPIYSEYFGSTGIKKDKINSFITSDYVELLGSWTGSIIPEFTDKVGNPECLVDKINNNTIATGLLASFNKDAAAAVAYSYGTEDYDEDGVKFRRGWFTDVDDNDILDDDYESTGVSYQIDLVGHNYDKAKGIDFLSYRLDSGKSIDTEIADVYNAKELKAKGYDLSFLSSNQFIVTSKDSADKLSIGDFVVNNAVKDGIIEDANSSEVSERNMNIIPGVTRITNKVFISADAQTKKFQYNGIEYSVPEIINDEFFGYSGFYLYTALEDVDVEAKEEDSSINAKSTDGLDTICISDGSEIFTLTGLNDDAISKVDNSYVLKEGTYHVMYNHQDVHTDKSFEMTFTTTGDNVTINDQAISATPTKITIADKFVVKGGDVTFIPDNGVVINTHISKSVVIKRAALTDSKVFDQLTWIPMKGLKITSRHQPGYDESGRPDREAGIEKIYKVLTQDEGVHRGLLNDQMVSYRYIIDSMSGGLDIMMGGKVYLSNLAKDHGKCTAILNAPSKKEFVTSRNPYFCDQFVNGTEIKPAFSTKYIPLGGNDKNFATKKFSLPDVDNGATYTAVFFPNLTYSWRNHEVSVPPAADVANVLIRKFTGSDPYMICANNNGIISNPDVKGVEMALDHEDRDALEPFGINSIITRDGNIMIYGNETAYQRVQSDFNKLHVRENLNTIEIACDAILQNYVFLYNNAQTRADIVQKLTPVLEAAKTSGAIDSYTIQCDEKNNTEEIISADYGVVDLTVVMNHGMEKIVQRITLKRNGKTQAA